jgi:predicted transcriptional regulator/transcriptional regulator with XRE-family HTH domain
MGATVRRLRRESGLTQAGLARQAGISTSYLNLIEHNRRPLTGAVALALAEAMEIDPHELSGGEEARMFAGLLEAFGDPLFGEDQPSREELLALAAAPQNVVRALLKLHDAYRFAREEARTLAERLADETLANAPAADIRGLVASIRSFGEILYDHADIRREERVRFLGILVRDAEQLTDLLEQLPGSGRDLGPSDAALSPSLGAPGPGEAAEFLEGRNNYFPSLEEAAADLRAAALGTDADRPGAPSGEALAKLLAARLGVAVRIVPGEATPGRVAHHDAAARQLVLSETLAHETRAFEIARHLALGSDGPILDRCLEEYPPPAPELTEVCREALADYFARAVLMPYAPFRAAAQELRYDIERLGLRFGTGFEAVCHRLTTLRKPGDSGVPFHLVRVDIAGNVTQRFNGSGLRIARYGGVCPRWNLHEAFLAPGTAHVQLAETPDGARWLNIARTVREPSPGPGIPARHVALAIGCDVSYAEQIAYAGEINLETGAATPIGVNCRLCSRADCAQRVFRPLDIAARDRGGRT